MVDIIDSLTVSMVYTGWPDGGGGRYFNDLYQMVAVRIMSNEDKWSVVYERINLTRSQLITPGH